MVKVGDNKRPEVLITGASGEIGQSLVKYLHEDGVFDIVATDLRHAEPETESRCTHFYVGDIRDNQFVDELEENHCFSRIFHLAGLLSSSGEKNPALAHEVNVNGSLSMMRIANRHGARLGVPVRFIFTSSIAVYGLLPSDDVGAAITERQYLTPITMYGINKYYIEEYGTYFSRLVPPGNPGGVPLDFRCVRFPGLISADTLPTGGTTDYGPEMLHAAAQGKPYTCYVRSDSTLPFMVMRDAIQGLHDLADADPATIKQRVYNLTSFSVTAAEITAKVKAFFPNAEIDYEPVAARQRIVDSWPRFLNDEPARREWGWKPEYDFDRAFEDYLIPKIQARYR
jgi:threonine 3-dehydrogenase